MSVQNMAIIPYIKPMSPMKFIKSEVERGIKNGTINSEQLAPRQNVLPIDPSQVLDNGTFGQKTAEKMADVLKNHSLQTIYSSKTKNTIAKEIFMFAGSCAALIPYIEPMPPMEFIKSEVKRSLKEVKRGLKNGTITSEQLAPHQSMLSFDPSQFLDYGTYGQKTVKKMTAALKTHSLQIIYSSKTQKFTVLESSKIDKKAIEKIFAENSYRGWQPKVLDEVDQFGNRLVQLSVIEDLFLRAISDELECIDEQPVFTSRASRVASKKLNGEEIAEILQSEAGFTIATDKKPILATYGCGPCVALGGYDPTNKIAFIVHFSNAGEVRKSGALIIDNIAKLAKEEIKIPIQLHLRGGWKGDSEEVIEAIEMWMKHNDDLPMEIVSEDVLNSFGSKSLSIDSRTGMVSDYDCNANPKAREMSQLDKTLAILSAFRPQIQLAYSPK